MVAITMHLIGSPFSPKDIVAGDALELGDGCHAVADTSAIGRQVTGQLPPQF